MVSTNTNPKTTLGEHADVDRIVRTGDAETLMHTKFLRVDQFPVQFPNGASGSYLKVNPGTFGGIAIAWHKFRGVIRYALVQQHRFPIDEVTLEFPRGGTEDGSAKECLRELQEETGVEVSDDPTLLGHIYPDTGLLGTKVSIWMFRVTGDIQIEHVEAETGAKHIWVTGGQMKGLIGNGKITCSMTLAAFTQLMLSGRFVEDW